MFVASVCDFVKLKLFVLTLIIVMVEEGIVAK